MLKWKGLYHDPFPGTEETTVETTAEDPKDEPGDSKEDSDDNLEDDSGPPDAESEERAKVIALIKEYEPRAIFQAKTQEGISTGESTWPPSLDGCNRLLEICAEIVQKGG